MIDCLLSGRGGRFHEPGGGWGLDTTGGSGGLGCGGWGLGCRGGGRGWALHGLSWGLGLRWSRGLGGGWGFGRRRLGCRRGGFRVSQFGLWDRLPVPVDADGDLHELAAVFVPDVDAVLAGVVGGDFIDHQAGELPAIKCDSGVLIACHLLLVFEPGDLRSRLAEHGAGQAQRLDQRE